MGGKPSSVSHTLPFTGQLTTRDAVKSSLVCTGPLSPDLAPQGEQPSSPSDLKGGLRHHHGGDAKPSLLRAHGDDPLAKGEQRALDLRKHNKKAILDSKRKQVTFNAEVME